MKEIYVGIDPSINSTGVTVNVYDDGNLIYEHFYIIKPNKLTRKEDAVQKKYNILSYYIYNKLDDAYDSHEQEIYKTLSLTDICLKIINIIRDVGVKHNVNDDNIYIGMEGISYGSSVRTRSIYDLAGLNYLIRYTLIEVDVKNLYILPPTEVKKFATGIGNCSKDAMINIFRNIYTELVDIPKLDDIADSWFICNYVINYVRDIKTKKEQS